MYQWLQAAASNEIDLSIGVVTHINDIEERWASARGFSMSRVMYWVCDTSRVCGSYQELFQ